MLTPGPQQGCPGAPGVGRGPCRRCSLGQKCSLPSGRRPPRLLSLSTPHLLPCCSGAQRSSEPASPLAGVPGECTLQGRKEGTGSRLRQADERPTCPPAFGHPAAHLALGTGKALVTGREDGGGGRAADTRVCSGPEGASPAAGRSGGGALTGRRARWGPSPTGEARPP